MRQFLNKYFVTYEVKYPPEACSIAGGSKWRFDSRFITTEDIEKSLEELKAYYKSEIRWLSITLI